jgi:hypothetical protein
MTTPIIDSHHFDQKARWIRARAVAVLTKWGLLPRFRRWRLTQDPDTGMIVLFGILNNEYIATNTLISFSDYFDPRLLHDLANELQVQVVSCNSDGLRYAFILDRGQIDVLPSHIDFPFIDHGKLLIRVVQGNHLQSVSTPSVNIAMVDDQTLVRQGVRAFLKIFDDIKPRDDAALQFSAQNPPDIVVIEEGEFNERVAEHETGRQTGTAANTLYEDAVG